MMPADPQSIGALGENRMVSRFRQLASGSAGREVLVGPGDDAAVITVSTDSLLLLACDMMIEGTHFRREWARPWQIGWKAMVQNLSDIAAMGGEPAHAVASVGAPADLSAEAVEEIARGMIDAADKYGASLVGGDLVGSPGPIVVDVAITGHVAMNQVLTRRGAQPGDAILVTGMLGASAAGLEVLRHNLEQDAVVDQLLRAHHEPQPRLDEGRAIARAMLATAMMDLSDGLAEDLPRLCAESGVGARLRAKDIPLHPNAEEAASRLGADALRLGISGGEDYELLITCPPSAVPGLTAAVRDAGSQVNWIGDITREQRVVLVDDTGNEEPLGAGFDHFRTTGGEA